MGSWQDIIALAAVLAAALYLAARAWRGLRRKGRCGCGTASCIADADPSRSPPPKELIQIGPLRK